MKALISACALFAFVAASTVPFAAPAQAQTKSEMHKPAPKKAKKHVAKAKKHKKVAKKRRTSSMPAKG